MFRPPRKPCQHCGCSMVPRPRETHRQFADRRYCGNSCSALSRHQANRAGVLLQRRQSQVLVGIACGLSNGEIAQRMEISPETVRTHVANLLSALGATNRAHAVALGYQHGLLVELRVCPARSTRIRTTAGQRG